MLSSRSLTTLGLVLALGASASTSACLIDTAPYASASGAGLGGEGGGAGGLGGGVTTTGQGASSSTDSTGASGGGGGNGGTGATGGGASGGAGGVGGAGGNGGVGGAGGNGGAGGGPVAGETCPGIPASLAVYESVTFQGNTTIAADDHGSAVCGGGDAPDLVYEVTAKGKGLLVITLDSAPPFLGFFQVRKTCDLGATESGCNDTTLTVPVESGDVVTIIVDGHLPEPSGTFDLTVYLDGCGNGQIDLAEECDDGNLTGGDTCAACKVVCSSAGSTSTEASVLLDPATFHCYLLSRNPNRNWDQAAADCVAWGGTLASLTSTTEMAFVDPLFDGTTEAAWIGGNDKTTEGTFAWLTPEDWVYPDGVAPWSNGNEPNDFGSGEDCVEMGNDGKINDEDCGDSQNYLCERPPAGSLVNP